MAYACRILTALMDWPVRYTKAKQMREEPRSVLWSTKAVQGDARRAVQAASGIDGKGDVTKGGLPVFIVNGKRKRDNAPKHRVRSLQALSAERLQGIRGVANAVT